MRAINVNIKATMRESFSKEFPKGKKVIIDKIKGYAGSKSYLSMHVVGLAWLDSGWFRFGAKKRNKSL